MIRSGQISHCETHCSELRRYVAHLKYGYEILDRPLKLDILEPLGP